MNSNHNGSFPCTMCGGCCRNIDKVEELAEYNNGKGVCVYLSPTTNSCLIYNRRPEICRIDKMYERHYKDALSLEEFYDLNKKACNEIQEALSLPSSFRLT